VVGVPGLTIPLEMAVQVEAVRQMSTQLLEQEMQVLFLHQKAPTAEIQLTLLIREVVAVAGLLLLELR